MGKGQEAERRVAKRLSKWLHGGDEDFEIELWRSVLSGGWKSRQDSNLGDLRPDGELGKEFRQRFAVEVKARKSEDVAYGFLRLFSRKNPLWEDWWDQITLEAAEQGLCPLLIVLPDHYENLIAYPPGLLPLNASESAIRLPLHGMHIIPLETFLSYDPEEIYECHKGWNGEDQ